MLTNSLLLLLCAVATPSKAYKIAIVPKITSAEGFYGLTRQGCLDRTALSATNSTCYYTGTYDVDIPGTLQILNDLIDDPTIDAISVSVLDEEAYTPVINRGMALGKPIITFDSDAPGSNRLAYVGTDNYAMGRELAKLLRQVKPDGGTYGIVSGFGHNLENRVQGVRDGLNTSAWSEVAVSPKNGNEDSDISLQKMWELVEENPGLGAIVSVVGLPMFKENTTDWKHFVDSNRDVLTVIADTLPIQLELMQTSYVDALVGQLPYNMGYQGADTLLHVLEAVRNGTPLLESLPSDVIFITHQLEVLRIPLQLPPLDFDYNYIGAVAIVGYVLCGMVVSASLGFMVWTACFRKNQVVQASQPVFLTMICVGCMLMGSAIIPLSIDDETSQQAADIACMCVPWLVWIGFSVSFGALFSKTWRLNKIFLNKTPYRRMTVTEKDVILPFVILLTMNIITLSCWTAIAPLHFVRTLESGTDPWNRPIGSYGQCRSTSDAAGDAIPYLVVIAVVNIAALIVANFQSYRARNVRTEFNESTYVGMAMASFLQAILVCVPIIFLTRENPQAYFVVLSVVLFIMSGAILVFIFVPKILSVKENKKGTGQKKSSVRVSGLMETRGLNSSAYSGTSSIHNSSAHGDSVAAFLQQFQSLSWEDKTAVLKKLGATQSPAPSSSGGFDAPVEKKESSESVPDVTENAESPAEVIEEVA